MASTSNGEALHPVVFSTQTPYPLPSQKFMIPRSWKRYQLSQLVNKALSLPNPIPFDFLVRGEILRGTLEEWCKEQGVGEEETLEIEYFESVMPPQKMSSLPHDDWVSSVSCQIPDYLLSGSYDGHIRFYDYSQRLVRATSVHYAPLTSICVVPSQDNYLVASASQDLTARMTVFSLEDEPSSRTLASLHLHTAPVSSVASSSSGNHLLTASWDGLVGLWDTTVPATDEVPDTQPGLGSDASRKKRRKVESSDRPVRKAPLSVLKSHTARVSRALFEHAATPKVAYSCGLDATIRKWDIENGICTDTITASARPFLGLVLTPSGHIALAASTDRTVSAYDLRAPNSTTSPSFASFSHPSTPSCIATLHGSPASNDSSASSIRENQFVTGGYDGIVRLWDLRSVKSAVASFKAFEGSSKKVLSVDWRDGLVCIGGEGGMEVWKMNQGDR